VQDGNDEDVDEEVVRAKPSPRQAAKSGKDLFAKTYGEARASWVGARVQKGHY
jgi:hypothetical protein